MLEHIENAVHTVFEQTIGVPVHKKKHPIQKGYVSHIALTRGSVTPMYCIFKEDFLRKVASILFMEDNPSKETLIDLANELNNLFAGTAKTLASESGTQAFGITTPEFVGITRIRAKDAMKLSFEFKGSACTILLGHIHA